MRRILRASRCILQDGLGAEIQKKEKKEKIVLKESINFRWKYFVRLERISGDDMLVELHISATPCLQCFK